MNGQRFAGKVAVITGGNSGIGLGAAKAFAAEGAKVAISGRDEKTIQAALRELGPGALGVKSDVSRVSEIESFFAKVKERFGKIDALFVNAGIGKFLPLDQVTEAVFDEIVAINLKGVYFTVQKALPLMPRGSAVVLNASVNAHMGMAGASVYGATKAAVINLAKGFSSDLLDKGIRVNVVSPGPITTPILNRTGLSEEQIKQTRSWVESLVPLKRFGTVEELASAVLFLASPESSYMLGSEIIVDGGLVTL